MKNHRSSTLRFNRPFLVYMGRPDGELEKASPNNWRTLSDGVRKNLWTYYTLGMVASLVCV